MGDKSADRLPLLARGVRTRTTFILHSLKIKVFLCREKEGRANQGDGEKRTGEEGAGEERRRIFVQSCRQTGPLQTFYPINFGQRRLWDCPPDSLAKIRYQPAKACGDHFQSWRKCCPRRRCSGQGVFSEERDVGWEK